MNFYTGIATLVLALVMVWAGRPDKNGVHPRFLRFHSALVLYPPLVLAFLAFGIAAAVTGLQSK